MSGDRAAKRRFRLSPRDTWPDLRIIVHVLPWTWSLRPRFYRDDLEPWGFITVDWLFLKVEWWANDPPFTEGQNSDPLGILSGPVGPENPPSP